MSGFVAVVNTDGAPVDPALLARLTGAMAFRGPDAQRTWVDGAVGLGHTLLATVDDYPEVPQPCSLDGRVWLAGDVRVDGRAELVGRLRDRTDADLRAASDPELVLHAYRAWGDRCAEHLIGDFAFAVWDGVSRRLLCARDHMGVKQLYYAQTPGAVVVSNSIDAIRMHPAVPNALDECTIAEFLVLGGGTDALRTGFEHVRRLAPAHVLTWSEDHVRSAQYWAPPIELPVRYRSEADYVDRFAELFCAAVTDRLRCDEVGVLMSGGLDSTAVAGFARKMRPSAGMQAYTTVCDEVVDDNNERVYAGQAASYLQIGISYEQFGARQLFRRQPGIHAAAPAPLNDLFEADRFALNESMSASSRVLLTGHGGDAGFLPWPGELLEQAKALRLVPMLRAVYNSIADCRGLPALGFRSALARSVLTGRRPQRPHIPPWVEPALLARTDVFGRARECVATSAALRHPYRQTAYESLTTPGWDAVFESLDAGVTRSALDYRHPFFDVRLTRFLLTVPSTPYCVGKRLLRSSCRGVLPEAVRLRPKAPLRNDPVVAMLRRGQTGFVGRFEPTSALSNFVRVGALPTAPQIVADPVRGVVHLRPYSLDQWFSNLGGGLHAGPWKLGRRPPHAVAALH